MDQDLLALRCRELLERRDRSVDELFLERLSCVLPVVADVPHPPPSLLGQGAEGAPGRLPETGQEPGQHIERSVGVERAERCSRPAALQQHGLALVISGEQADGPVAVPEVQRGRLVLALPVGPLDLQHGVAGREDDRDVPAGEGLLQLEVPLLRALLDQPRKPLLPGVV